MVVNDEGEMCRLTIDHLRPQTNWWCSRFASGFGTTVIGPLEWKQLSETGHVSVKTFLTNIREAPTFLPSYPSSFAPHFCVMYLRMSYGVSSVMDSGFQPSLSCW